MPGRAPFFRNFGLKLFALAVAIVVWFILSAQRRERISERSYRIGLSVVNIPPQTLIASPLPAAVEIRVRGPFTALRQLDPQKLEAVIDLADAPRGERLYRLAPEDLNVPDEVQVIAIAPSELRIALDAVAVKTLSVEPKITGKPAEGWDLVDVSVEPRFAKIVGPAGALAQMMSLPTDPISIEQRSGTWSVPATVRAEAPGGRITEGQIVTVTVKLHRVAAPVPTPSPLPRKARHG